MNYKTHTRYAKIAIKHSVRFFLLATIAIAASNFFQFSEKVVYLVCFLLISSIGISHGALDNIKGKKLLNIFKIKNILFFYLFYVAIAFLVLILWFLQPSLMLIIFLIFASYHFGKEDTYFFLSPIKGKYIKLWYGEIFFGLSLFLKGFLIIAAPLKFSYTETQYIFSVLSTDGDFMLFYLDTLFYLSCFTYFWFMFKIESSSPAAFSIVLDFSSIILLNYFLSPLVAFTIYFCFLHSVRHSISLILMLNKKNLKKGTKQFLEKAFPLTLITALIFVLNFWYFSINYELDVTLLRIIFIGLASLTFPHILLEYLLEKNEKKS
ncbi:Brp/Blh family beta-carotene 15,15'-dioxygenase [Pelagibacteraceae bacterium]|nr:Brp/Blh family beta-carotene 15,15'-dioxygenase [Pelagibacteraceae bacterium]